MNKEWTDSVESDPATQRFRNNLWYLRDSDHGGIGVRRAFLQLVDRVHSIEKELYGSKAVGDRSEDWHHVYDAAIRRLARATPFEIARQTSAGSDSYGMHVRFNVTDAGGIQRAALEARCSVVTSIHPLSGYAIREYVWHATIDGKVV